MDTLSKAGLYADNKEAPLENSIETFHVPLRDAASFWTQLRLLLEREKISLIKNPAPMIINCSLTGFLAFVFGIIFYQIGTKDRTNPITVQSQLGALMNINMSTMMGQASHRQLC